MGYNITAMNLLLLRLSDDMSHVLHLVIARASGKMTTPQAADAAVAVLYQVCQTILSIYPNQDLILLVTRKIDGESSPTFPFEMEFSQS